MDRRLSLLIFSFLLVSGAVIPIMPPAEAGIFAVGGTITTSGAYTIHTFTSSGFFNVTAGSGNIEVLVVAGGGGGGSGGGGAGGYRTNSTYPVTVGSYTVTIGAGGPAATGGVGATGSNTTFGQITSAGGGGGGLSGATGKQGGSGGGGGDGTNQGGSGNLPPKSPAQGFRGGHTTASTAGGGGGGGSAVGASTAGAVGGNGGAGTSNSISGASVCYAGGGGGGGSGGGGSATCGGGGGTNNTPATAGTANTGGGGGGTRTALANAAAGGSGVVIVRYLTPAKPDAVTTLVAGNVTISTATLAWDQPALNGETLLGYRINYTTPHGQPTTVLVNNSGSSSTRYSVSDLNDGTQYSFRVSALTAAGGNITSGTIANITTIDTGSASYTPGSFDFNATNTNVVPITFLRTDINTTHTTLNVTYPRSWSSPYCDLSYQILQDNQTYSLNGPHISSTHDRDQFTFINLTNDIVDVYCANTADSSENGRYVLSQLSGSIPILELIANFRDGDYGTAGMFGAIDLITLVSLIIAMIGFNRVNESVGMVFALIMTGFLSYFEVIQWYTTMMSGIALVVMLVFVTTRKD